MERKSKIVSFVSLKGGVGKSTAASLLATNIWHNHPNIAVSLWDLDPHLWSYARRNWDLSVIEILRKEDKNNRFLNVYETAAQVQPLYPIRPYYNAEKLSLLSQTSGSVLPSEFYPIKQMFEDDAFIKDLVIVDFPSTCTYKADMLELLKQSDCVIICCTFLPLDIWAQKQYCQFLANLVREEQCQFADKIFVLWTRSPFLKEADTLEAWASKMEKEKRKIEGEAQFPFPSLKTVLPESDEIQSDRLFTTVPLLKETTTIGLVSNLTLELFSILY